MSIFILNLISLLFYSFLYNIMGKKSNLKKYFIAIITLQLILILSMRHYTIGVDVFRYLEHFRNISHFDLQQFLSHRFEIGYKLLNKFIGIFTLNEQVFLTIIATITIIPVGRFIYKYSKMPFLSFGLYIAFNFYSFAFSGLRQAIACGIILISYDFVVKRKIMGFIICILLAGSFHQSALLFFPAYYLYKVKITKKIIVFTILVNFLLYTLRKEIFTLFTRYMFERFDIIETGARNWMLLSIIIIFLSLLFYKRVIDRDAKMNSIYMLVIVGVTLMVFSTIGSNAMRVANYYYIFVIILIPEVLSSIKDKMIFIIGGYIVIISVFVLHIWFLLYPDTYHMVPYRFFWL